MLAARLRICLLALLVALPGLTSAAGPEPLDRWRGKVVLLDFWASWCGPCRESFPWMNELQRRYGADLIVVAVNMDQDPKLAAQFLAASPAMFRIEYDPQGKLATQFDVSTLPMSFLIDRNGRIRSAHRGFTARQQASREAALLELIKE
jgi:cytochrome c biogenesis protein CcmG, thiol:disulfide interchange protein DsbE